MSTATISIKQLILVYNADLSLIGGLNYLREMLSGTDSCALCTITHDTILEKQEWKNCKASMGIDVRALYRNRLAPQLEEAIAGEYPVVLAETTDDKIVKLVNRPTLEACNGDLQAFLTELKNAARALNLDF